MKIIIISLIFTLSLSSLANEEQKDTDSLKVDPKEVDTFLEAVKEKDVEEQLVGSELFQGCQDQTKDIKIEERNDKLRECVKSTLEGASKEQIDGLSEKLNLAAFDKEAAESTKSIREYLNERLSNAIYGEEVGADGKLKALKDKKFASHDIYYQLYMEQLGKNTLLSVSQYCLENFGYEGKDKFIDVSRVEAVVNGENRSQFQIRAYDVLSKDPNDSTKLAKDADGFYTVDKSKMNREQNLSTASLISGFWKQKDEIKEYTVCNADQGCADDTRSVKLISALKDAELTLGESSDAKLTKDKYEFCATQVVKNMCEIYKCNNVYKSNGPEQKVNNCKSKFDIDVASATAGANGVAPDEADLKSTKTKGQIACNIMERLESYRKAIVATKEVQKQLAQNNSLGGSGFNVGATFKNIYDGSKRNGNKSIDDLTSISSSELTTEVSEIAGSEDEANELRDRCLDDDGNGSITLKPEAKNDEQCTILLATLDKETYSNIKGESETQTAVFLDKLEEQQLTSDEEIQKFLAENNLQGLLKDNDFNEIKESNDPEKLKELIKAAFKAKKMSELDAIRAKFDKEEELVKQEDTDQYNAEQQEKKVNQIAEQTVTDIENHKKRVESLFQYSNIVSSYLAVTKDNNGTAEEVGSNITGRVLETESAENTQESGQEYLAYFGEGASETGGSSSSEDLDYLQALDAILYEPDNSEQNGAGGN